MCVDVCRHDLGESLCRGEICGVRFLKKGWELVLTRWKITITYHTLVNRYQFEPFSNYIERALSKQNRQNENLRRRQLSMAATATDRNASTSTKNLLL